VRTAGAKATETAKDGFLLGSVCVVAAWWIRFKHGVEVPLEVWAAIQGIIQTAGASAARAIRHRLTYGRWGNW